MMDRAETVSIESYLPFPDDLVPYEVEFSEANGIIKLRETDSVVEIGIASEPDDDAISVLENHHAGKKLRFLPIDRSELASYLGKKNSEHAEASGDGVQEDRHLLDKLANDAPIVNLVNSICIDGIRKRASDIHIEAMRDAVNVRYRIDGVLQNARRVDKSYFQAISSRVKIMADLNIMERRLPQDGRMSVDIGGDTVDLRVSIVPISGGESIVMRLFNKNSSPLGLDDLGFSKEHLKRIRGFLKIPHGLVLVTGPTGSGKTTTLNAMLRQLPAESLKIMTIEDPVEYLIDGVNQIQTNEAIKLGFDSILRRVLRQDPNVIMVGEIRDSQTAELATRAALTGHLVLSTLHTNSSAAVIPRLRNMGIPSYLIASVLKGAIAQRLGRKNCPHCAAEREPDAVESRLLGAYRAPRKSLTYGSGCDRCNGTGFSGRLAVAEVFAMTDALEEIILDDGGIVEIGQALAKEKMKPLASDGMEKAAKGLTTISELEREITL